MPTARPRHLLTESDGVRAALDVARARWPEEHRPTALLVRLIEEGRRAVGSEVDRERAYRLEAIRTAGTGLEGVYPEGHLEELRQDWPE